MSTHRDSVRDALRVAPTPGAFTGLDTGATPLAPGKKSRTTDQAERRASDLAALQERLFAEGTRSLLLVLQGIDTSGKGGVIGHVVGAFGPEGVRVTAFKKPSAEELAHEFLWRIRKALPPPGLIGVFDRSHYEDVLVPRVHHTVPEADWRHRYELINEFEAEVAAAGTVIVKCLLHISYDTQRERLLARLDDPAKHWKFHESDLAERALWPAYQAAFAGIVEECSTEAAPWYVVPSDHKWYRNWAIGELMFETLSEMDPRYPQSDLDVAAFKQRLQPPN